MGSELVIGGVVTGAFASGALGRIGIAVHHLCNDK